MAQWLRQATTVTIPYGPFLDATDGTTPETSLTLTQPDLLLSKNGAAFAQKNAAQTLAHLSNGFYGLSLDTTDTGTLGRLEVQTNESGALPVWKSYDIVPAAVWDAYFTSGSDTLHNVSATDILTQVNAALDTILSTTIPADGTRPTLRQGVYMTIQFLTERSILTTTLTIKNPDGTTLFTETLNSATTPTSYTRTT
jgi:hypothetical protein